MDDVEFLWNCVREGKFSKESTLELLDKCNEIFGDVRGMVVRLHVKVTIQAAVSVAKTQHPKLRFIL